MKMHKKKFEFSKIIIFIVGVVTIAVTTFTLYMVWETKDLSVLAYLIPAIYTETASATGFYFWKARTENKIRMSKELQKENIDPDIILSDENEVI